jgi:hypothetical protein
MRPACGGRHRVRDAHLAFLCSTLHSAWAWKNSSTMKADLNYSPSDVFETFVQPELTDEMDRVGRSCMRLGGRSCLGGSRVDETVQPGA